jgi:hypothetical protein
LDSQNGGTRDDAEIGDEEQEEEEEAVKGVSGLGT